MAAVWAYLSTDDDRRAPALVESARRAVLAGADWRVRQMEAHPFRAPIHPDRALVGWGSFGHSARAVLSLAAAYRLTGDGRYRMAAWDAPAPQFGANPLALSRRHIDGFRRDASGSRLGYPFGLNRRNQRIPLGLFRRV